MHEKETWKSMQDFKKLYLLNFGYYFGFLIFPNEVFQLFPSQHLLSRKPYWYISFFQYFIGCLKITQIHYYSLKMFRNI